MMKNMTPTIMAMSAALVDPGFSSTKTLDGRTPSFTGGMEEINTGTVSIGTSVVNVDVVVSSAEPPAPGLLSAVVAVVSVLVVMLGMPVVAIAVVGKVLSVVAVVIALAFEVVVEVFTAMGMIPMVVMGVAAAVFVVFTFVTAPKVVELIVLEFRTFLEKLVVPVRVATLVVMAV